MAIAELLDEQRTVAYLFRNLVRPIKLFRRVFFVLLMRPRIVCWCTCFGHGWTLAIAGLSEEQRTVASLVRYLVRPMKHFYHFTLILKLKINIEGITYAILQFIQGKPKILAIIYNEE